MQGRSSLLAVAGLATLVMAFQHGSAQAAPKGWKCSYAIAPVRNRAPIYYACYGKSLSETRARARAECRRLNSCDTGACLPLEFTPRRTCGRE